MEQGDRFWQLIHYLVTKKDYMIVHIREENKEIWLQNFSAGKYPFIYLEKKEAMEESKEEEHQRQLIQAAENMLGALSSPYSKVLYLEFAPEGIRRDINIQNLHEKIDAAVFDWDADAFVPEEPSLLKGWRKKGEIPGSALDYVEEINGVIQEREEEIRELQHRKNSYVTYVLMALNVLLFLLMEIFGGSENAYNLIRFGAKFGPFIAQGQIWRFFTYMFLHIGINHLAANILSLYVIGPLVDQLYGKWRFLTIYFLSGVAGGVLSFALSPHISAGASGAIFGLMGSLLYIGVLNRDMFRRTIGQGIIIVVLINLFYGFSISGIDNLGHLGGLVGGFLAAGILGLPGYKRPVQKIICGVALLIFLILFYGIGLNQYMDLFS